MSLDYRVMSGSDWICLLVVALLWLLVCWMLWFQPIRPWNVVLRRLPENPEKERPEQPPKGFVIGCRIVAVLFLLVALGCILSPFLPALRGM